MNQEIIRHVNHQRAHSAARPSPDQRGGRAVLLKCQRRDHSQAHSIAATQRHRQGRMTMTSAAPLARERRKLRDEFERRERHRMGLPPKPVAERPRQQRAVNADAPRLIDSGLSPEAADEVARANAEAFARLTPYERLLRAGLLPPRRI